MTDHCYKENILTLEKGAIAKHCNLRRPEVAPIILGFNYEKPERVKYDWIENRIEANF